MKFVKYHLTFIFPMMAILIGIELFIVFDRTTDSYEANLREGYSMFVVSNKPMKLSGMQDLNRHISRIEEVDRDAISVKISRGISESRSKDILKALPYFYNIKLDSYMSSAQLGKVKQDLEGSPDIKKVEIFGSSYSSSYRLFSFIKFTLKAFLGFMAIISFFLIVKQMEIWKYAHYERMQIMKIFGASLMLRSGVLFRVAIVDAIVSTFLTSGIFLFLKYYWAQESRIDILIQKRNLLFEANDFLILLGIALGIVIVSVYLVVFDSGDR